MRRQTEPPASHRASMTWPLSKADYSTQVAAAGGRVTAYLMARIVRKVSVVKEVFRVATEFGKIIGGRIADCRDKWLPAACKIPVDLKNKKHLFFLCS